jgi:hypothetical protein
LNRDDVKQRIETIEESYEFFLAFAAQGATGDAARRMDAQVREFLQRTDEALSALTNGLPELVDREGLTPAQAYRTMIDVVREDARRAGAAVALVLAQPAISSQLIDNLNASIHLRALLTDLFLLDEVL